MNALPHVAHPSPQDERPILSVENLVTAFSIRRGGLWRSDLLRAVNDVSLSLGRGKTLGLVGESGCGKSTLGRTILGLTPALSGAVRYEGVDLLSLSGSKRRDYRRRIQVVFQDPYSSLDPRFSVHDVIAEPLQIHDCYDKERIARLMLEVGLSPAVLDLKPAQFSGGQRQRIAIARALALRPEILILDEAVSALDVSIQAQVLNLLKDLQRKENLSYLFISHNLGVVRHIADEVAVMYLGRIVEIAPTRSLFERPRHPYTRALLSAVPTPDPRSKSSRNRIVLQGDPPNPLDPPSGCAFRTRCYRARPECAAAPPPLTPSPQDASHRAACLFPHDDVSEGGAA